MFLHKAIKPARLFINRILALLREMGDAPVVAIDEGFHRDLQWFIACAQAVNGSVTIFKCVQPRAGYFCGCLTFWFRGVLNAFVYQQALVTKPDWCIAHWEAINVFVALQVFSSFLSHQRVTVWCDSRIAVSVLQSGRGLDPILHTIARKIWLLSSLDCDVVFSHIPGWLNGVADLLLRWDSRHCLTAELFSLLGMVPCWLRVPDEALQLDHNI
jgi:hypothetical protein